MVKSQRMWRREQERRRQERLKRLRRRRLCAFVVVLAVIAVAAAAVMKACSGDGYNTTTPAAGTDSVNTGGVPTEPPSAAGYTSSRDVSELNMEFFDNSAFLGDAVADTVNMYGLVPQASFYTSVNLDLDNVYTTAVGYGTVSAADTLKSTKFSKIFLSFGSSELELNDAQEFAAKYEALVDKVKTYQQNAQIYAIAIPPSSMTAAESGLYGATVSNITEYNRRIENIAEDCKLFYVDSVTALANSNRYLPDGVSADGISLNRSCTVDLLYYIVNNSYVPDSSNTGNTQQSAVSTNNTAAEQPTEPAQQNGQNSQNQNTEAQSTQNTSGYGIADTPQPTVNVLKDSAAIQNR